MSSPYYSVLASLPAQYSAPLGFSLYNKLGFPDKPTIEYKACCPRIAVRYRGARIRIPRCNLQAKADWKFLLQKYTARVRCIYSPGPTSFNFFQRISLLTDTACRMDGVANQSCTTISDKSVIDICLSSGHATLLSSYHHGVLPHRACRSERCSDIK